MLCKKVEEAKIFNLAIESWEQEKWSSIEWSTQFDFMRKPAKIIIVIISTKNKVMMENRCVSWKACKSFVAIETEEKIETKEREREWVRDFN